MKNPAYFVFLVICSIAPSALGGVQYPDFTVPGMWTAYTQGVGPTAQLSERVLKMCVFNFNVIVQAARVL